MARTTTSRTPKQTGAAGDSFGNDTQRNKMQEDVNPAAGLNRLSAEEAKEWTDSWNAQQVRHKDWDEKERLLQVEPADSISPQYNNHISDGRLSTIVIERAARIMARLPTGIVRVLTKKNAGLGQLLGLFLTRYIQPNDNAQFPHLVKLRMTDMYSQVYGVMPILYDMSVTDDYLGPMSAMLPIRSWFPQPWKMSIDDSDYNHVETRVSASTLEKWLEDPSDTWDKDVLRYLIARTKEESGNPPANDVDQQLSMRQREKGFMNNSTSGGVGEAAQIRLVTRYGNRKSGHWKTFAPGYDNVLLRDIPSKDGHIPIVLKHHIPLIDDIYGLGAFERGKRIQYAMDSLVAMYMAGVQMSIFPPRIIQKDDVVTSSLRYEPGATWIEKIKDAIRNYQVSPQGLETFQSTYGWLTGSLLNQNGTTDTSVTTKGTSDPAMGKTPQAIQVQQQRESAADAWDLAMMEGTVNVLYERMLNLAPTTPKPFTFHIFDAEIKQIEDAGLKDVLDVFQSKKEAKVTLSAEKLGNGDGRFLFTIDAGTTQAEDMQTEHMALDEVLKTIGENPMVLYYLSKAGKMMKIDIIIERWIQTSGLRYGDDIIVDIPKPKPQKAAPQQGAPKLSPAMQAKVDALPPAQRAAVLAHVAKVVGGGQPQGGGTDAGGAQPNEEFPQTNPMFYPNRRMIESINVKDLPLWAQVQLLPIAGIQVPDAVNNLAMQMAQNPQDPTAVPTMPNVAAGAAQQKQPTDPTQEFLLKWFDKLSIPAQRQVAQKMGFSPNGILPAEAEIIQQLTSKAPAVEDPSVSEIPQIDPQSPYGAAVDPHAHLQGSQDPMVQQAYKAIMAAAPGKPMAATPAPAAGGQGSAVPPTPAVPQPTPATGAPA